MKDHREELLGHVNPDVTPLGDDELEDVAGGISKEKADAAAQAAKADGRTEMLPSKNLLCIHNHKYKWARRKISNAATGDDYYDIKCYKPGCGKTWYKWSQ